MPGEWTMKTMYLSIAPHDPIIARDGRPFGIGQGIRMRSLDWPYPSVLAGSLRTMLGKMNGGFSGEAVDNLLKDLLDIRIAGPLPLKNMQLYLPIPKDILAKEDSNKLEAIPLRPANLRNGVTIQPCRLNRYKFRQQSLKWHSFKSSLNRVDNGD